VQGLRGVMPAGRGNRRILTVTGVQAGRGEPRWYRSLVPGSASPGEDPQPRATTFVVREGETDIWVCCRPELDAPRAAWLCSRRVRELRAAILRYASRRPGFLTSLKPLPADAGAPPVVRDMLAAGDAALVGPMAAVAGAIAEHVARFLQGSFGCTSVVVENGGDVFALSPAPLEIALLTISSPLGGRLVLRTRPAPEGLAVCTSSGTAGPSRSFGRADAATVLAAGGALADALATAMGNRISSAGDVEQALTWLSGMAGAAGGLAVCDGHVGAWGQLEVLPAAGEGVTRSEGS